MIDRLWRYWEGSNALSLDLRCIAFFRIASGILILLDLAIRAPHIAIFYTAGGACPVDSFPKTHYTMAHLLLYRHTDSEAGVAFLFALAGLAALALVLGFHSRLAAALSFYFLASLHNRNVFVTDGGDLYLRVMMFWAIFLPLGARWSLDARRNPHWAELPDRFISVATFGFISQVAIMYATAGLLKNHPVWTETGDALYLTLKIEQFSTHLAHALVAYPNLLRCLSFIALHIELCAPLFLFCPFLNTSVRTLAVLLFLALHLGIASCLHLGLFMPICLVIALTLLPTRTVDVVLARLSRWVAIEFPPRISWLEPAGQSERPSGMELGFFSQVLLWSVWTYLLIQNALTIPQIKMQPNDRLKYFIVNYGRATGLMQNWSLFAPYPFRESGWYVIDATTRSGAHVDLLKGGGRVVFEKPPLVSAQFINQRWRCYLLNLYQRGNPKHVPLFLRYMKNDWNKKHPESEQIDSLKLVFMLELTQLPGYPSMATPVVLGEFPSEWLKE